ncbi:peptidoglycan peptidase [bacterium 336/3]|nr:peptidoglycan peptidase [bacterium 336/3]
MSIVSYQKYNPIKQENFQKIKDRDIIFHVSLSGQGKAIQLATKSKYTHCGIIYEENGNFWVYEAIQPVQKTPLKEWIQRGDKQHYVIKRLKNASNVLIPEVLQKMKDYGKTFQGKNYDIYFSWSDDRIYCSELVWKIYYKITGIQIGKLQKLREFDLTSSEVKQKMQERYGNNIPFDEDVISPASIFHSKLLTTIISN